MPRDEAEAAYFTLLRAREELDGVRRYGDYLREEARRIRRFVSEGDALADTIDLRLRRVLRYSDGPVAEAIQARLSLISDELSTLPDREAAAEAFVADCEREHEQLRGRA